MKKFPTTLGKIGLLWNNYNLYNGALSCNTNANANTNPNANPNLNPKTNPNPNHINKYNIHSK